MHSGKRRSLNSLLEWKGDIMKITIKDFLVQESKKVKLEKWPTLIKPVYRSTKDRSYLQNR